MRAAALAAALAAGVLGCREAASPPPDLLVVATAAGFEAPDTVPSGWHRLRFHQRPDGQGRNLVIFAIPDSLDAAAFADALDMAIATPAPAVALGGSESPATPADTTSLVLHLEPGRYLLAAMGRGENGRRHVSNGYRRELRATADSNGAVPPRATAAYALTDFAFAGPDTLDRGAHRLRLVNEGRQDHLLLVHRLAEGRDLVDWIEDETGTASTRVGGLSRVGPGREAFLDLGLQPGRYVFFCLIPDPATGRMHAELGMVREVTVSGER